MPSISARCIPAAGLLWTCLLIPSAEGEGAAQIEEIRVKRKETFAFTTKPSIQQDGDRITIQFAVKAFCDVSVAIENEQGRIVRHVAGGVLGPNAPAPFQQNALEQKIAWDGKDDLGAYVDQKERMTVRVSLGLKPQYERALFWSPYKRYGAVTPLIHPAPEGVYVFESRGKNTLRLYDHQGTYVRTVHPPSAEAVQKMKGIEWLDSPQTGKKVPVLRGFCQMRFLTCSEGVFKPDTTHHGDPVWCATGMAVHKGRIALAYMYLNRLSTDGTTGGLPLEGPEVGYRNISTRHIWDRSITTGPSSMAFSPDGKTLYLGGYFWNVYGGRGGFQEGAMHGVRRMAFEREGKPEDFLGNMGRTKDGRDNAHFAIPSSVACDAQGRVYVSDYLNDRIQVFSPVGKYLKTLPVPKPAKVMVSPRDGQIVVFSWRLYSLSVRMQNKYRFDLRRKESAVRPSWTRLGTFDKPRKANSRPLPTMSGGGGFFLGQPFEVAWDHWAAEPTLWIVERKRAQREHHVSHNGSLAWKDHFDQWGSGNIRLFALKEGEWVLKKDFNKQVRESIHRPRPASLHGQRVMVDPCTGKLYLLEYRGFLGMQSNFELLQIDAVNGKVKPVSLPISAEDVCFDWQGHAYLRDDEVVMRFAKDLQREIPWDYGEERMAVGMAHPRMAAIGALALPSRMPAVGHQEGMFVNTRGRLAVSCHNLKKKIAFTHGKAYIPQMNKPYEPALYPGRIRYQELHVFDKHGQLLYEDAVPGLAHISGVALDREDFLYVLAAGARVYRGKSPFNPWSGALIKFKPKKGRIIGTSQGAKVKLAPESYPARSHDLENGNYGKAWVDGAEWFYGGVGFFGMSQGGAGRKNKGLPWDDWHSRFAFDGHARSFVHELDNFSIAVVDRNGNLVLRFGQYGNEQDGIPLIEGGGAVNPKPIGGSEVALCRPTTLATDSDRRLFITDAGNSRIVGVKLNYHVTEKIALRNAKRR